ncbi:MAG: glycosyltransferase family 87 protein, partial [Tepidisphaeraceae bacterium]
MVSFAHILRHALRPVGLRIVAAALLIACGAWWVQSLRAGCLVGGRFTRVPAWEYLGLDFRHNYHAARHWAAGGNPFIEDFGDWHGRYAYPPIVLPMYAWCAALDVGPAMAIWMACIAAIVGGGGAWLAWRTRSRLGITQLPLLLLVAIVMCSMPVIFAMERGQCDAVALLMILGAASAFTLGPSWKRDALIGACIAVAAWVKVYPGALLVALLALGAWRAFGLALLQATAIGLVPYRATMQWLEGSAASQKDRVGFLTEIVQWARGSGHAPAQLHMYAPISVDAHSLSTYWATFWNYLHADRLARTPGVVGAALLLVPLVAWVGLRVHASPARLKLAYPVMLWMTAVATFWMPVSFDYNLFFLLLAALAVCDGRRDPWWVLVLVAGAAFWWQPFHVPLPRASDWLFLLKLSTLIGVGASLVARARERPGLDDDPDDDDASLDPARLAPQVVAAGAPTA